MENFKVAVFQVLSMAEAIGITKGTSCHSLERWMATSVIEHMREAALETVRTLYNHVAEQVNCERKNNACSRDCEVINVM